MVNGSLPAADGDSVEPLNHPRTPLQPGERILTSYLGETFNRSSDASTADPQMLVLTDRRIFRASIIAPGRTFVLEQAEPGQLSGGASEPRNNQVITTVLFNGRQPMSVSGGTPEASGRFAEAITVLARDGPTAPLIRHTPSTRFVVPTQRIRNISAPRTRRVPARMEV